MASFCNPLVAGDKSLIFSHFSAFFNVLPLTLTRYKWPRPNSGGKEEEEESKKSSFASPIFEVLKLCLTDIPIVFSESDSYRKMEYRNSIGSARL